ncbi:MAG: Ig-like domain-containing protein [Candidatus Delongbacteria bacterium]
MKPILLLTLLPVLLGLVPAARGASLGTVSQTVTAPNGTVLEIPLEASFGAPEQIHALTVELDFPTNWLVTGLNTAGTLLADWGAELAWEAEGDGIQLAAASASPMTGTGTLALIQVQIQGSGTLAIPFARLNEGDPVPVLSQGTFTHIVPQVIPVSPATAASLLPGETVQYTAGGAPTPPLTWSVADPLSGQVSAGGLFTALSQGANRVQVADGGGRVGTGPEILIHTFHLQAQALSGQAGQTRPLVLVLQNPTGAAFSSAEFSLNLGSARLTAVTLELTEGLLADWDVQFTQTGNLVQFAAAAPGGAAVTGAGQLLVLQVASSVGAAFNSTLTLSDIHLDEDWLTRTSTVQAQFSATSSFTLSPATASILRGQTQQVTIQGTPNGSVEWTSTDPAVASVSATGQVTALSGGDTRIIALDPLGVGDTTGVYHVHDLSVAPASQGAPAGSTLLVPLNTGALGEFAVTAWQFRLSYPTTWLQFDGLETAGSLSAAWTEVSWDETSGVVQAAAAGPALAGAGSQLVFLRFLVDAAAPNGQTAQLQLPAFTYNEGLPSVQRGSGTLTFGALPPTCQLDVAALDFGAVLPGTIVTRSFSITNVGGGTLSGTVSAGCPPFTITAGATYSLTPGQSQQVELQFQSPAAGTFGCLLDTGGSCADLPLSAAAVGVTPLTGPESACGLVEVLGHLPGSNTGFVPDWEAGAVGLQLEHLGAGTLSASIWIGDELEWSGQIQGPSWSAASAPGFSLSDWTTQDLQLHLEVSDGSSTWNAAGADCIWELGFLAVEPLRPGVFRLYDAVPNPFNPSTTLSWELPAAAEARLELFDLQGRLVRVLAAGPQAAGPHSLRLNADELASGVYLLRLSGPDLLETKRLLLLK